MSLKTVNGSYPRAGLEAETPASMNVVEDVSRALDNLNRANGDVMARLAAVPAGVGMPAMAFQGPVRAASQTTGLNALALAGLLGVGIGAGAAIGSSSDEKKPSASPETAAPSPKPPAPSAAPAPPPATAPVKAPAPSPAPAAPSLPPKERPTMVTSASLDEKAMSPEVSGDLFKPLPDYARPGYGAPAVSASKPPAQLYDIAPVPPGYGMPDAPVPTKPPTQL